MSNFLLEVQTSFNILKPGTYVPIITDAHSAGICRRVGFELRDTILVVGPSTVRTCYLFRKPIEEKTVVKQVLTTYSGVMNIEACRVKHSSKEDFETHKAMVDAVKAKGGVRGNSWKNDSDLSGASDVTTAGRWPANLVLVHAQGCTRAGEVRVDAPVINRFDDGAKPFGNGAGHPFTSHQTGDSEGKETLTIYTCTPECLVGKMNEQSADLKGRSNKVPSLGGGGMFGHPKMEHPFVTFGDSGGASRFFSQFESEDELQAWLNRLVSDPESA